MSITSPFVRRLSTPVPGLPPGTPLIVFDNVCVLCSGFVQWVIRHDKHALFRFTSAQGPLGQALYRDLDLDTATFETNLLVVDGMVYGKFTGLIEIVTRLGGAWRAAAVLKWLPAFMGDWIYDRIACNRYALFGKRDVCWLPSPEIADRVI